jgi:hypothetical protein
MAADTPRTITHSQGRNHVTMSSGATEKKDEMQGNASRIADQMKEGARESAQRVGEQTRDAWSQAKDDPSPMGIMKTLEEMPSTVYLYTTLGSMGLSLLLRMAGRKDFANFVGLWPPTILALAMLNKQFRPSREM